MFYKHVGSKMVKHLFTGLTLSTIVWFSMLHGQAIRPVQAASQPASANDSQSPRLRQSEALEVVIADLEQYIPTRMEEQQIPGVAIALIRDHEVVWEEGFGVTSTLTGSPVTPDTIFEVASLSKPVLAYTALRLVDRGLLELDEPLVSYLPEPWLPPSEYSNSVTMRHALSHSSGITNNLGRQAPSIPPGTAYFYSATGISYTQAVIEEVTGQPLEAVTRQEVFEPLGMTSSTYTGNRDLNPRITHGHIQPAIPLLLFMVPALLLVLISGLIGLIVQRIWIKQWHPKWQLMASVAVFVLLVYFGSIYLLLGEFFPEHIFLIFLCNLIFFTVYGALIYGGKRVLTTVFTAHAWTKGRGLLAVLWAVITYGLLIWLTLRAGPIPTPKSPVVEAGGAGTLRATAGDLAHFMVELEDPQYLGPEVAIQLSDSQIKLNDDLSWGLGYGIIHSREGDAYWQWGQTVDFQTIMIIYPEQGLGVVVVTNGGFLNTDTVIEIAQRAIGGPLEPFILGSRLEYNYHEAN